MAQARNALHRCTRSQSGLRAAGVLFILCCWSVASQATGLEALEAFIKNTRSGRAQFVQQVKGLIVWVIFVVGASMLVAAVFK